MIDFLSSVPLRPITRTVYNNLPIAIVEFDEESEEFSFLHANEAYVKILELVGAFSIEDAVRINSMNPENKKLMIDAVKKVEKSGTERISLDCILNNQNFSTRIRFIARQNKKVAIGLVSREKMR